MGRELRLQSDGFIKIVVEKLFEDCRSDVFFDLQGYVKSASEVKTELDVELTSSGYKSSSSRGICSVKAKTRIFLSMAVVTTSSRVS